LAMLADSFGKLRAALDATPSFYRVGISLPRKLPTLATMKPSRRIIAVWGKFLANKG
jgi:hypothetical protein